jgi:hypothetical protein
MRAAFTFLRRGSLHFSLRSKAKAGGGGEIRTHDPNAHIFQRAAKHERSARLSNQFRNILVDVGLAEAPDYSTTTKGRASKRESSELSFHSLRHSAVTMLEAFCSSELFPND